MAKPSCDASLERAAEEARAREEAAAELRESLARLRDDYSELQSQYAAMQRDGGGKEALSEMRVGAVLGSWAYLLCGL